MILLLTVSTHTENGYGGFAIHNNVDIKPVHSTVNMRHPSYLPHRAFDILTR